MPNITLLGLGPGSPALLTRQAWQVLESASEVYLRTNQHPTVAGFPAGLTVYSFDHLYEQYEVFEEVYAAIVEAVLELGRRDFGVIYAVPGHPLVAEATGPEIRRRARAEGWTVEVVEGLSFLEPTLTALGLDAFPQASLVDALDLAAGHHPLFPPHAPALAAQLYSQQVAGEVKVTLMNVYPDEYPVKLVHGAGTADEFVEELPLYQIDRSPRIGLLTTLYIPPLPRETSFEAFQELIAHLRAPEGCPWDRQQTHQTLRPNLLEETYEALEALDAGDPQAMREEFGDLLLQILLHAQIATEDGEFSMGDVLSSIHTKLVHRHPHVFDALDVDGAETVIQNWEKIKAEERHNNGEDEKGLLGGVAQALPALAQADAFQKRAGRVGFDWPEIEGVWAKIEEEMDEVRQTEGECNRAAEIGDLLFVVVNLARWYQVDAESALREANARFKIRFAAIESSARLQGRVLSDLTLEEMDAIWEEAKKGSA